MRYLTLLAATALIALASCTGSGDANNQHTTDSVAAETEITADTMVGPADKMDSAKTAEANAATEAEKEMDGTKK